MGISFFQILNYTLAVFMWLIIGRVILSLFIQNTQNFMLAFFIKFTEPMYRITRTLLPFAQVSPEKRGTVWEFIGGCIPFFSVVIVIILRTAVMLIAGPRP